MRGGCPPRVSGIDLWVPTDLIGVFKTKSYPDGITNFGGYSFSIDFGNEEDEAYNAFLDFNKKLTMKAANKVFSKIVRTVTAGFIHTRGVTTI
jgi:hypothetical protein